MPFFPDDLPRAQALAELLCGAAAADDDFDPDERDTVRDELRRLLGALPAPLEAHLATFKARAFDLQAVLTRVHPSGLDEKRAVMRAVRAIVRADGAVRETEHAFLERVGQILRVPTHDID